MHAVAITKWRTINVIVCTIGGGLIGFYIQERAWQKDFNRLRQVVPQLERELESLKEQGRDLEKQVERGDST